MRKAKGGTWDKNTSPVGWYVASLLHRFEWYDEDKDNLNRRCLVWQNQILIKAIDREEAYNKAVEEGRAHEESGEMWETGNETRRGRWRFEGLTSLLPIYDELEDGAEITWKEYKNRSVKKIKSWVKLKEELEVFSED
jgi:hypothetical protein